MYCRVDRQAKEQIQIGDLTVPKGMVVNIPIYAMHRNPEIWPEPDTWKPERYGILNKSEKIYWPMGFKIFYTVY